MNITTNPTNIDRYGLTHTYNIVNNTVHNIPNKNLIPIIVSKPDTDTNSFLKTEQSSHNDNFVKKILKKESIDLNDQFDVIISKYSLIKNKLNKLWNKLD